MLLFYWCKQGFGVTTEGTIVQRYNYVRLDKSPTLGTYVNYLAQLEKETARIQSSHAAIRKAVLVWVVVFNSL